MNPPSLSLIRALTVLLPGSAKDVVAVADGDVCLLPGAVVVEVVAVAIPGRPVGARHVVLVREADRHVCVGVHRAVVRQAAVGFTLLTVTVAVSVAVWLFGVRDGQGDGVGAVVGVRVGRGQGAAGGAAVAEVPLVGQGPAPPLAAPVKETDAASLAVLSAPAFAVGPADRCRRSM